MKKSDIEQQQATTAYYCFVFVSPANRYISIKAVFSVNAFTVAAGAI